MVDIDIVKAIPYANLSEIFGKVNRGKESGAPGRGGAVASRNSVRLVLS